MTNWIPALENRTGPRYLAIAQALADDVTAGRLRPGDRLPTHRDLGWKLGVTVGTVSRAYAEAERRGLIVGEVGRGTYVRPPAAPEDHMMLMERPDEDAPAEAINLSFAFPAPGDVESGLARTLADLAADPQVDQLLGYHPHGGMKRHKEAGARWLRRSGFTVERDQVLVTCGAQHGIGVCLAALTRPGDRVLTDALTYSGMQTVSRMLGLRLDGIAGDEQGMRPDLLDAACQSGDAKALYLIPTMHNPTTLTMPEARRREIAAVARRHNLPIIEDDLFTLLVEDVPPPLQAFAPELTYAVTSFSKSVSPGLRIGYVAGPPGAGERLATAVRATCWMAAPLTAEIATRWVLDGTAERVLAGRRSEAAKRRALALRVLQGRRFTCPPGAIYLWLELPEPWRSSDFALEAQRRGVAVTPAQATQVSRHEQPDAVRVCLGPARDHAQLERGLRVLCDILDAGIGDSLGAVV